jgi:hypothetical protein
MSIPKNKTLVLSILIGFVVTAAGASLIAYNIGYGAGFVEASSKANESWLAQSREMIKENGQFLRAAMPPANLYSNQGIAR